MRERSICSILYILIVVMTAAAQEQDSFSGFMHGIRANTVKGDVTFQREGATFPLESGLKLAAGDIIKTTSNAYAELLLQPGNYLRLAPDTEIQLVNDEHDRMRLKLKRGTINLEILARENVGGFFNTEEARYLIRVITPSAVVFVSDPGIYRINTAPPSQTDLTVRNGAAVIQGHEIKAKRRALVSGANFQISEIDSKIEDAFDTWARERAEALVRANKDLKKTAPWAQKQKDGQEPSVDLPKDGDAQSGGGSPLVVSARPGTVNFVDDGVEFNRGKNDWQELKEQTHLETGDRLRTPENCFAELMLFPDMSLRVAERSELLFKQLSNDAISIQVLNGSAILDVARFDRKQAPEITIGGPSTAVTIADSGNYRIDSLPASDAITVRSGKVTFKERLVGSCRAIAGDVVSDCEKKHSDNFDQWSRYRGEGEVERGLSTASFLAKTRRLSFQNAGFWYQEPGQTTYTFVPFTSELFRSPYGGNYSTAVSPRRRLPRMHGPDGRRPATLGPPRFPNEP